ncbi:MAG TPA: S9 family peptidase, partial [Verrucomicrobium sp.]|nr:S9 family peptidase [Verrucomicrobium sp.]
MRPPFLLLLVLACFVAVPSPAAAPDYREARKLASRTENSIFRAEVRPRWLADGKRFWYCVKTGPNALEFVLVNAESGTVKREKSFKDLGLTDEDQSTDLDLSNIPPTRETGTRSKLRIINERQEPVELFWNDFDRQRRSYGRIQPGDARDLETYAGHVW